MGARLMRRWMLFPLRSVQDIERRLDSVEHSSANGIRELCEMELGKVGDLERIVSKVATGRINPREMQQLRCALETGGGAENACKQSAQESIRHIGEQLDACTTLRQRIERELRNDPPLTVNKGQVIADGVNAQLDELRNIQTSGKDYLLQIQEREIARTGIQSLKSDSTTSSATIWRYATRIREFVPQEWIRKQTLVNAERYITQELKEYEEKILGAEDKFGARDATLRRTRGSGRRTHRGTPTQCTGFWPSWTSITPLPAWPWHNAMCVRWWTRAKCSTSRPDAIP